MTDNMETLSLKLLIVDDDKPIADIIKEYLSNDERTVDVCYDGSEAVTAIEKASYDIVVVDLFMPGLGGMAVLKYAKASNPDTIVIVITGYASLESAITAVKEGAYDYIRKPFKLDEIRIAIDKAINQINVIRENRLLAQKLAHANDQLSAITCQHNEPDDRGDSAVNFYDSSLQAFQYLYDSRTAPGDYVEKLQTLSSFRESGLLTETEFKEFKKHLLKQIHSSE